MAKFSSITAFVALLFIIALGMQLAVEGRGLGGLGVEDPLIPADGQCSKDSDCEAPTLKCVPAWKCVDKKCYCPGLAASPVGI